MAILIKGMGMPSKCIRCPVNVYGRCLVNDDKDVIKATADAVRDKDCPLIEVPEPHGDLIDANEMFVEFVIEGQRSKRYKLGEKWELNGEEIRSVISRLPTIIPASEEVIDEAQRDYQAAADYQQYCETYEQTYDPNTGAM